jgi:SAM-dependent methyltransferase
MAELTTDLRDETSRQTTCCEPEAKDPANGAHEATATAEVRTAVRERYAAAARAIAATTSPGGTSTTSSGCCSPAASLTDPDGEQVFGAALYETHQADGEPDAAIAASLGCGVPTAVADLKQGETVLDLGSGAGADVLISARRVGPTGTAIGLDMTDEMLALAQSNASEAGATNVEFLKGHIEAIPLPADSVDVVISNCVINLAADKPAVFREIARVLKPGGRMGVTDIVAEDRLTAEERAERGSYTGCIAGALSFSEFRTGLAAAGLSDVTLTPTHDVADGMVSVIVQARKPADARPLIDLSQRSELPVTTSGCCGGDGCCS